MVSLQSYPSLHQGDFTAEYCLGFLDSISQLYNATTSSDSFKAKEALGPHRELTVLIYPKMTLSGFQPPGFAWGVLWLSSDILTSDFNVCPVKSLAGLKFDTSCDRGNIPRKIESLSLRPQQYPHNKRLPSEWKISSWQENPLVLQRLLVTFLVWTARYYRLTTYISLPWSVIALSSIRPTLSHRADHAQIAKYMASNRSKERNFSSKNHVAPQPLLRAALCFFGLTRSLKHVYLSIAMQLIQPLLDNGYQVDKFLHTYNLSSLSNKRSKEINVELDPLEYRLLKPLKQVVVSDQSQVLQHFNFSIWTAKVKKKIHDPWNDGFQSLKNLACQLHSLEAVTKLWLDSGDQYDLIVYSRPDVLYLSSINADILSKWKREIASGKKAWVVPAFDTSVRRHYINDRFAFGDAESMALWGRRVNFVKSFVQVTKSSVHAERLVGFVAKAMNVSLVPVDLRFVRVRANGKTNANFDQGKIRKWNAEAVLQVANRILR